MNYAFTLKLPSFLRTFQVSTTIFQTFKYDTRLNDGTAYLAADYSIERDDPTHQDYVIYAALMAVLYCFGIPAASWAALHCKKDKIQQLQLLSESIEELENGGTSTSSSTPAIESTTKNVNESQRKKSVMHKDLVSSATRRFSGVGVELNDAAGATLKGNLLKLQESMQEDDPWLAGLSPLYKVCPFLFFLFFYLLAPP